MMNWEPLETPPTYPDVCVGKGLAALRENEVFKDSYDFTIKVGNEEFKVHKLIMIASSHYFKAMFASDMTERNTNSVELKKLNSLAVSNIIEYIYTNKITGKKACPEDLLECAAYLQIPPAIEMASKSLKDVINVQNCLDILHIFESYSCKCEMEFTREFILSNFDDILKLHDLERMSFEQICQVVELWGNSEWDLITAIQKWISIDPGTRNKHTNSLMSRVRFGLMKPGEIQAIIRRDIYSKSDGSWKRLIDNAVNYHKLPAHKKILDFSEQSKVRANPMPVVVSADQYDWSWALQKNGSWKSYKSSADEDKFINKGAAGHEVVNNFLIVCATISPGQEWHIFDPRTMTWSSMAKMNTPRKEFALVHEGHFLYALGGCTDNNNSSVTDSMEKYNFETDTWNNMDSKLPVPKRRLCACQLSDSIYIIGGFPAPGTQCQYQLDCFHPCSKTWESKTPMLEKRMCYWMNVVKLRGEEFIHVMCDNFIMMYYNPRTDQWSMWTSFSDLRSCMHTGYYEDGVVLARNDTLFLLNFDCYVKYPDDDGAVYTHDDTAHCYMWKLHTASRYVREEGLGEFPLTLGIAYEHVKAKYISGLLSFLPESVEPE